MNENHTYTGKSGNIIMLSNRVPEVAMEKSIKNKKNHESSSSFKITFEFPPRSSKDEEVKREVKAIMSSVLREQLEKIS